MGERDESNLSHQLANFFGVPLLALPQYRKQTRHELLVTSFSDAEVVDDALHSFSNGTETPLIPPWRRSY
jgi:hypothetical protein